MQLGGCLVRAMSRLCARAGTDGASPSELPSDVEEEWPEEKVLALVPWADLLNHSSAASERSLLQYDDTADAAVLFAHKSYAAGDEVFDSYGKNLTPSELLLDYGFVDTRNSISAITARAPPSAALGVLPVRARPPAGASHCGVCCMP